MAILMNHDNLLLYNERAMYLAACMDKNVICVSGLVQICTM